MAGWEQRLGGLPSHAHDDRLRVFEASTFLARLRGLAGVHELPPGVGLHLPRTRSVHTFGMRFPIDVVFLDRHGWPIAIRRGVRPGRVVAHRHAAAVIETRTGEADRHFVVLE